MEPMTLGSPVSNAIPNPSSPGGNTMYLPSFLLGDTNTKSEELALKIIVLGI